MGLHKIKINLPGLLKMLGSNIYAESDAAVREMIQNAHDTCIIRKDLDDDFFEPEIRISYDKIQQTLTFSDNGAGMTEEELHKYLSTIGEGFTKIQKDALKGALAKEALLLIGQFGIGLLSAFSVADRVEVFTRSYLPGTSGFKWECAGDIDYTVEPVDKSNSGTRVVLHVTDKNLNLLDDKRLQQAIKRYADFLSLPIYLNNNQINSCTPPWLKKSTQEEYAAYFQTRYDLLPIVSFPFHINKPIHLNGLFFIPSPQLGLARDFGELDIYIARMFVKTNDKELLPSWAQFVKGVLNTSDLTPTLSRDELVHDEYYDLIRHALRDIILQYLAKLEEQNPETVDLIVKTYNNMFKARSLEDEEFFDLICNFVQVNTNVGYLPIQTYLQKSNGVIYYFWERGMATQQLLLAQKGLSVIDASWGVERNFIEKYAERKGIKIERLEADSSEIFTPPDKLDDKWHDLECIFKQYFHRDVKAVAFEPSTVPAVLVTKQPNQHGKTFDVGIESNSTNIEKMFEKMHQDKDSRMAGDDKILHLNTTNSIIQQLPNMPRDKNFELVVIALCNNVLLSGNYVSPETMIGIITTNNTVISTMIAKTMALAQVRREYMQMENEYNKLKRKIQVIGEATVPLKLLQRIANFLKSLPNIEHDIRVRQALLLSAGLGAQLQQQVDVTGSTVQFIQMLVDTLSKYGRVGDGRHALEAVMYAAKEFVGIDKQAYCETLIQQLQDFSEDG